MQRLYLYQFQPNTHLNSSLGRTLSSLVIQQAPVDLQLSVKDKNARLHCRHGDNSYPYMYWYQQKASGSIELIGMLHYENPTPEDNFKTRFKMSGHSKANATLSISNITTDDSAVYYCAASMHSGSSQFSPPTKKLQLQHTTVKFKR